VEANDGAAGGGRRLVVHGGAAAAALSPGASIAVDGVCLTAREVVTDAFAADLSEETAARTTLARLRRGDYVNLELPVAAGAPLGGHIVQGHVDAAGVITTFAPQGANYLLAVEVPAALMTYIVPKGSVAVAGISLTVAEVGDDYFAVVVVPYTYGHTTLKFRRAGDRVNVEVDIIAKYVARLLKNVPPAGLTYDKLIASGFAE